MPLLSLRRDERGFTMVTVIIAMMVVMLLCVAALSAAQNDLPAGQHDTDRKVAYAAAEAGVQNYLFHLVEDPGYWSKCATVGTAVNNVWDGTSARKWTPVAPGSRSRYTIELLPANDELTCDVARPDATMIDDSAGTLRIRVTGQALEPDGVKGVKRSIVLNLRQDSLLDYVWFTDKESQDGALYAIHTAGAPTDRNPSTTVTEDVTQWAPAACNRYYGNNATTGNRAGQGSAASAVRRRPASWPAPRPARGTASRWAAGRSPSRTPTRSRARCTPTTRSSARGPRRSVGCPASASRSRAMDRPPRHPPAIAVARPT